MDGESSVWINISGNPASGEKTALDALRAHARTGGERLAFSDPPDRSARGMGTSRTVTFAQADAIADTVRERLRETGLEKGDVIAIQAPNTIEGPLLLFGAWRAGLVPCLMPMHWHLSEVQHAISRTSPKAAIGVGRYGGAYPAQTLGEAAAKQLSIRYVFAFGDDLPDGVTPIGEWLAAPDVPATQNGHSDDAEPAGDTSHPALITWAVSRHGPYPVARTHGELMVLARAIEDQLELTVADTVLAPYPLSGIASLAGLTLAPLLAGAHTVLHLPFDFDVFIDQMRRHQVTFTAVPAPVITAIEEHRNTNPRTLRLSRVGCVWPSPHSVPSGTGLFESPFPIFDIHGFGELAVLVRERGSGADPSLLPLGKLYAPGGEPPDDPVLETRVRGAVTSQDDHQVLKGTLFVRGATVPSTPAFQEEAGDDHVPRPDTHGFIDTGLDCFVDETVGGHFRCVKNEELIYHGGAVIAACELDSLYSGFSEFLDAAAFALDDAVIGERIFAAVVPKPELSPSLGRLKDYLATRRVAPYKAPDQLVIVKSIPRNLDGTILRDQILSQL